MKTILKPFLVAIGLVVLMPGNTAQAQVYADSSINLEKYLVPVTTPTAAPDAQGFQAWYSRPSSWAMAETAGMSARSAWTQMPVKPWAL